MRLKMRYFKKKEKTELAQLCIANMFHIVHIKVSTFVELRSMWQNISLIKYFHILIISTTPLPEGSQASFSPQKPPLGCCQLLPQPFIV